MSERKAEAAQRRDARATPGPEDEKSSGVRKHKDKKRWCKGKVGVEHTPACMPYKHRYPSTVMGGAQTRWRELVCTKCGKILDYYYPFKSSKKPKPAWVTS